MAWGSHHTLCNGAKTIDLFLGQHVSYEKLLQLLRHVKEETDTFISSVTGQTMKHLLQPWGVIFRELCARLEFCSVTLVTFSRLEKTSVMFCTKDPQSLLNIIFLSLKGA